MDISNDYENNKRCFKLPHEVFKSLYVLHNKSNALTAFWNTYQIFIYENFQFNEECRTLIPEFNIQNLLVANNYLVCLDDNGNIHLTPLKFKHTQKKFKSSFQLREQGILCVECYKENTISIKFKSHAYYLCLHKINADFQIYAEIKLSFDSVPVLSQGKPPIFYIYFTNELDYKELKEFFSIKEIWKEHAIIFVSFDRINLYTFLYSCKSSNDLKPLKIYTSPSEITDINVIKINNLCVVLSLSIGTIIMIPLSKGKELKTIHLNKAIFKLRMINDSMIYTDGNAMWKCEFTENIKFYECFAKSIKDFIIIGDQVLCTTFSNLIYLFTIDESFKELTVDKYCPAEVLNNSDCLDKIMEEVEKSNAIIEKIKKEETYITTLSLSNRPDILDKVIDYKVSVFETFDQIPKEDITLIDNIKEYYSTNAFYFAIIILTNSMQEKFSEILSNMFGNLKIHIIFSVPTETIKTVSLNVLGYLKTMNIVVPLDILEKNFSSLSIDIKLVTSIPGVFNSKHKIWTVLHSKKITFNSEYFMKTMASKVQFLNDNESLNNMIYKTGLNHYGHLFKFNTIKNSENWSFYVKLKDNYETFFRNVSYLENKFNKSKAEMIFKKITSADFLRSKSILNFDINNNKVKTEIINDGFTKPLLRISCENLEIAFHIRNFFSELLNNNFVGCEDEKEFVNHQLYSTVEKYEQRIKSCIDLLPGSRNEFMELFEQYHRRVIGMLPI